MTAIPESPPPELHRPVSLAQLAGGGEREVVATAAECAAIAARLRIPGVAALSCRFRLTLAGDGVVAAEGRLAARVTRECVVTLEPFEAELAEAFRLRFVPADQMTESEDDVLDIDSDDELPYHGSQIDLGEAAVEQLALALDPYPRMAGATLPAATQDGMDSGEGAVESPFAALARRARQG